MSAPLVFLDTETTGLHPDRLAWEIAMIRRDSRGQRELRMFVAVDLDEADLIGLRVGQFYERHPYGRYLSGLDTEPPITPGEYATNYVEPRDAAEAVAIYTHGAHVVGAVPNFDTEVLDRLLRSNWLLPAWHYHLIDVESLAVGYLAARGRTFALPWKSDDLSIACGVQPPTEHERHTALGDARWAMRLFDAITKEAA